MATLSVVLKVFSESPKNSNHLDKNIFYNLTSCFVLESETQQPTSCLNRKQIHNLGNNLGISSSAGRIFFFIFRIYLVVFEDSDSSKCF